MNDSLFMNSSKPLVSSIKPDLEDLILCVKKAGNLLKNNFPGIS